MPGAEQGEMFDRPEGEGEEATALHRPLRVPIWTGIKGRLVAEYARLFMLVTKNIAYIDGFAGPQSPDQPNSWAAKLTLENDPFWVRRAFLCERGRKQVAFLDQMIADLPEDRRKVVERHRGDFNRSIDTILASPHLRPATAMFALLDQRTFECDWATVQKLARHKPADRMKVELFYFLPTGWLDRALSGVRNDRERKMERWWGDGGWHEFHRARGPARMEMSTKRFKTDLGYKFVTPWPIREKPTGGKLLYAMVHASDHPEAPKLMGRAYRRVTSTNSEHLQGRFDFIGP